jgi:hypothetical protein
MARAAVSSTLDCPPLVRWELAKAHTYNVPDHLFGAGEGQNKSILRHMEEIRQKIEQVNTELRVLALDIMTKVSQSTDEVSTALALDLCKSGVPLG